MQIELFPETEASQAADLAIEKGQVGPIRFASTSTSFPHLCRTLVALTATRARPDDEIAP
jgi:hypothetical protein